MISIIAAVDIQNAIAKDGRIPWYLPEDIQRFRDLTMGKPIIMGRKTFESLPKALPGRTNIVITRNAEWSAKNAIVAHSSYSLYSAIVIAREHSDEIMIIGGAEVYREALPMADRLYLTTVQHDFKGDVFFPAVDFSEWTEISRDEHRHGCYRYYMSTFCRS